MLSPSEALNCKHPVLASLLTVVTSSALPPACTAWHATTLCLPAKGLSGSTIPVVHSTWGKRVRSAVHLQPLWRVKKHTKKNRVVHRGEN